MLLFSASSEQKIIQINNTTFKTQIGMIPHLRIFVIENDLFKNSSSSIRCCPLYK